MKPTDDLKAEHKAVLRMLGVVYGVSARLKAGQSIPRAHLAEIIEFLRVFVDRCHHAKEETGLFPAMEQAGVPHEGGPIGAMLKEHEVGRGYVRQMAAAVEAAPGSEPAGLPVFVTAAQEYAALLTQHIEKENSVLFPLADKWLDAATQTRLEKHFEEIEVKVVGAGRHEAFHAMLHRMAETYRS